MVALPSVSLPSPLNKKTPLPKRGKRSETGNYEIPKIRKSVGQGSFPFSLPAVASYAVFYFNIAKVKNLHARPPRKVETNCPQANLETLQPANDCDNAKDPKLQTQTKSNPANFHALYAHLKKPCWNDPHAAD